MAHQFEDLTVQAGGGELGDRDTDDECRTQESKEGRVARQEQEAGASEHGYGPVVQRKVSPRMASPVGASGRSDALSRGMTIGACETPWLARRTTAMPERNEIPPRCGGGIAWMS